MESEAAAGSRAPQDSMRKVLFIHHDSYFADFMRRFLESRGFQAFASASNLEGITEAMREMPDLIIVDKDSPHLDAEGFLIKKRLTEKIKDVPVYIMGDFSPAEVASFKKENVQAFLSRTVNPYALAERITQFFGLVLPAPEKRTPMLTDVHARGHVIVIQVEGNLETDKILILNYLIRLFCSEKGIREPRLLFIVPGLYPETVTQETVSLLFSFRFYKELTVKRENIVILSQNKRFLEILDQLPECTHFSRVNTYYDGYRRLQTGIDLETKISTDFIKVGYQYVLDIFDLQENLVIPAMTPVTPEILADLQTKGITSLKYFGDMDLSAIGTEEKAAPVNTILDYITQDFEPISVDLFTEKAVFGKRELFFAKMRGRNILVMSPNRPYVDVAVQALGAYFEVDTLESVPKNFDAYVSQKPYLIVLIDLSFTKPTVVEYLRAVRAQATRRKTTVILLADKMNKDDLLVFRSQGTDHVILAPFTTEKITTRAAAAMAADRET